MGYTQVALEDKILDMYPEIRKYSISPRLSFNEGGNTWVVKLVKGKKEKVVKLSKQDADACMDNTYCEAFKDELYDAVKDLEEASEEHMGLQYKAPYSVTGNQMKLHPEVHAVSDIVHGLCESLKNIHDYRQFMHEKIKDILKRPAFTIYKKAMPDNWTLTREED